MISDNDSIDCPDPLTLIGGIYWFIDNALVCHYLSLFLGGKLSTFSFIPLSEYECQLSKYFSNELDSFSIWIINNAYPGKHIAERVTLIVDKQLIFHNSSNLLFVSSPARFLHSIIFIPLCYFDKGVLILIELIDWFV